MYAVNPAKGKHTEAFERDCYHWFHGFSGNRSSGNSSCFLCLFFVFLFLFCFLVFFVFAFFFLSFLFLFSFLLSVFPSLFSFRFVTKQLCHVHSILPDPCSPKFYLTVFPTLQKWNRLDSLCQFEVAWWSVSTEAVKPVVAIPFECLGVFAFCCISSTVVTRSRLYWALFSGPWLNPFPSRWLVYCQSRMFHMHFIFVYFVLQTGCLCIFRMRWILY